MTITPPKRILHLLFGKDGGQERFFTNLVAAFAEQGVRQKFIIRPKRRWKGLLIPLGEVIENHNRSLTLSGQLLPGRIRRLVRDWQPDVVMAWAQRASRVLPMESTALRVVRVGDFPTHLRYFQNADVVVGNTPDYECKFRELGWDKPVKTITNFPRTVDPRPVSRASLDTPEDAFVVSCSGRFVRCKGLDTLIRAVARVPDAWLWLLGDGCERQELEGLAVEEGIAERTRFIGWVDEPTHYIAATDAFCMSSRHEPLGNALLEAWCTGVPSVSTKSEGPLWFASPGEDTILIDVDDFNAMAAAFVQIRDDPAFAALLVANATAKIEAQFTKARIVNQYFDLFNSSGR